MRGDSAPWPLFVFDFLLGFFRLYHPVSGLWADKFVYVGYMSLPWSVALIIMFPGRLVLSLLCLTRISSFALRFVLCVVVPSSLTLVALTAMTYSAPEPMSPFLKAEIEFPYQLEIRINQDEVQANFRASRRRW